MKELKLKRLLLLVSFLFGFISCNKHNKNSAIVPHHGTNDPIHHQPSHKNDTTKIKSAGETSKNNEFDQRRIDSIKNSKPKPPKPKNGKGDK